MNETIIIKISGENLEKFKEEFRNTLNPKPKISGEFFVCPVCGKKYKPKYKTKEEAPEGTIYREQHISGICSNKCWNSMTKELEE